MTDLTIGTRLAVGFAVVLATTVAYGAFVYVHAASMDQTAEQLQTVSLPAAYLSEDLRSSVNRQYALFQQFLTSADSGESQRLDAAMVSERTRNLDLMTRLDALATNDKMRTSFDSLKSARDEFRGTCDKAINLIKVGTPEANQQALDMDARRIRPAYAKYLGLADALVDVSRNLTTGQPRSIDAANAPMSNRILMLLAAAILFSVVNSLRVIRSIVKPLSDAVRVSEQISNGDLTGRAKVSSQDEIGQLQSGLNRLLDAQWNAAGVAERLAEGDFTVHASAVSDRDVLGRALVRMRNNMQSSVEAAERLAAGEYNVQPRVVSDKDKLGNALIHLREVLRNGAEITKRISEGDFEAKPALVSAIGPLGQSLLRIREQLKASTLLAAKLADGEFVALDSLPAFGSALSRPLVSLHNRLMAYTSVFEKISEGDLTVEVQSYSQNDVFGSAMVRMLESLRRIAGEVISSATQVAGASSELIATAARLSQNSNEHTATAAETAVVLDGMADSLRQSADQSSETDRLASAAALDGKLGAEAISQTVLAMKEVAERLDLLNEIGRKSDMLTLAAAVEAARAGEHGSGFSVVASELRKVVERSQTAASEIYRLSLGGVKSAESAVEFLARLLPGVSRTAELVRELASASTEQNSGATRANQAILQLDKVIHDSVGASQQMAETAAHLVNHANELQSSISFFKLAEPIQTDVPVASIAPAVLVKSAGG